MGDALVEMLRQLRLVHRGRTHLSHAGQSEYYIDGKKLYGNDAARRLVTDRIVEMLDPRTTCVVGSGHGGVPLATLVADRKGLKLTLVRKEAKNHGLHKLVDGHVPTHEDALAFVEDVMTTGRSVNSAVNVLRPTGAELLACYAIVKRPEFDQSQFPLPLTYVVEATDLL